MSLTYSIQFDNQQKTYYSGQPISGRVSLTVNGNTPIVLEALAIKLSGIAVCNWAHIETDELNNEIVLDKFINLIENENPTLQPGTYTFNFEHDLPANIPSSYEGVYGFARYEASAEVKYENRHEKNQTARFTVIKMLDLNDDAVYSDPIEHEKSQTFYRCFLCCLPYGVSEPADVIVRLPVSGYAPGEMINIELKIINRSKESIGPMKISLVKYVTFQAHNQPPKTRSESITLAAEEIKEWSTDGNREYFLNIFIPPTTPTDTKSNEIFKITYFLKMQLVVQCFHESIDFDVPIVIGSHPILNRPGINIPNLSSSSSTTTTTAHSREEKQPPTGSRQRVEHRPTIADGNPPSYEEAARSATASNSGE